MSHETFVCKLCVALGVRTEDVKKIVHLPDILIRSTEDVVRLRFVLCLCDYQHSEILLQTI